MKSTLVYYELHLEKMKQLNLFANSNADLISKVKKFCDNSTEDEYLYTNLNSKTIIQIESIDSTHIFGSYGRFENLNDSKQTRARDRKNYNLQDLEDLIESFTYFFLDLKTNNLIIINNSKASGFKTYFPEFLITHFKLSGIYDNVTVENKISENIEEKIGHATKIAKLNYSYKNDRVPSNEFASVREIVSLENNDIRKATVSLYLKPDKNYPTLASKLSQFVKSNDDQFNSFTIDTEEEIIDAIEKTLSKKITIDISEDSINNIDKIKEILSDHLSSY